MKPKLNRKNIAGLILAIAVWGTFFLTYNIVFMFFVWVNFYILLHKFYIK